MYHRVASPGYYDFVTACFWESLFYDLNTRQLIFSVQAKAFSPAVADSLAHVYGKLIVGNMVSKHILIPKPLTHDKKQVAR
jgi:hypothetical protein